MSPHHRPIHDPDQPTRILVVEDEVLVRLSVAAYLRSCGYHVIEAKTADEAVAVLGAHKGIDMVFSDIQMPGSMDGFALAHWLHRERPDIHVLLTSGVLKATDVVNDPWGNATTLLPKPYDHTELRRRIEQLTASN
jgi:CheY-like chemotaxis protein